MSIAPELPASKREIAEIRAWMAMAIDLVPAKRDAGSIKLVCYACANQKGGVGKTTTTINLAAAWALVGFRVVVIDLDPQANATVGLGIAPTKKGTYYLFEDDEADIRELVQPTAFDNLSVVPAHLNMTRIEPGIALMAEGRKIIAQQRPRLEGIADIVMYDAPGNLGVYTDNALYGADGVIVPFKPGPFEMLGNQALDNHVQKISNDRSDFAAAHAGRKFGVDHVFINEYESRENVSKDSAAFTARHYRERYIDSPVPRRTNVPSSQGAKTPIVIWDPTNAAAIGYMKVARVIAERDKLLV